MDPGDAIFFHPNLLHRSDMNRSEHPRWSMICCYNAARNDPYKDSHHPHYTPLAVVPDSQVREVGAKRFADSATDVAWLHADDDHSAEVSATELSATEASAAETKE
jgi:ectoine hydroxylase